MPKKNTTKPEAGQKFHRWTLIEYHHSKNSKQYWLVRCECGTERVRNLNEVRSGATKSCGCYRAEVSRKTFLKHGSTGTPEYRIFRSMHDRCERQNSEHYSYYGGRGIYVCERWKSFENFIADMGLKPAKHYSLERKNNNGPYSPDNCVWATRYEQGRNKRNNHWITFNGETLILTDWAKRVGLPYTAILGRLKRGRSVSEALTKPLQRNLRTPHITE